MSLLATLLAVALSAGNAEFERTATRGAAEIAVSREAAALAEKGVSAAVLERAMLDDPKAHGSCAQSREVCRALYSERLDADFAAAVATIRERLSLDADFRPSLPSARREAALGRFDRTFDAARKTACESQARTIAGAIRPSEAEVETEDEAALRREMTQKVAATQKTAVFEENLKYISEAIVDPVLADAQRERKRQHDYLMRTRCEAYAPSALAKELEDNLRRNVDERCRKADDPSKAWGVFPKTLEKAVPEVVARRTLDRVTRCADDVPVAADAQSIAAEMAKDPKQHRRAADSEKALRGGFATKILEGALAKAVQEAPAKERDEFSAYVRQHAECPQLAKAVSARVKREVLPKIREVRAEIAKAEATRLWPTLADGTWYPPAELADAVSARSDYQRCVREWRKMDSLSPLAQASANQVVLEESDDLADDQMSAAFDCARNAINAQHAILTEVEPSVLQEAKARKDSFWRMTPDFKKIVALLTESVERRWADEKVETLWPDKASRPKNAAEQHAELFPSVRKRIELMAKAILEEIEKPEEKPEEPPPEEEPKLLYAISVSRSGDEVHVKLEQGGKTIAERKPKAALNDFNGAMKVIADKLGRDVLRLK